MTTLLNLIAGIDSPTAGTLTIGGTETCRMSRSKLAEWRPTNVG